MEGSIRYVYHCTFVAHTGSIAAFKHHLQAKPDQFPQNSSSPLLEATVGQPMSGHLVKTSKWKNDDNLAKFMLSILATGWLVVSFHSIEWPLEDFQQRERSRAQGNSRLHAGQYATTLILVYSQYIIMYVKNSDFHHAKCPVTHSHFSTLRHDLPGIS